MPSNWQKKPLQYQTTILSRQFPILGRAEILAYQHLVRKVPVADNVIAYAVNVVMKTRPNHPAAPQFIKNWISWGAGPRASQYLILGAKTRAILDGRFTPEIDDVRKVVGPVLRHRIVPNFNAEADGVSTIQIVEKLLQADGGLPEGPR